MALNVLDLVADGWSPDQAMRAAAIEAGESDGCTPDDVEEDSISPDEMGEMGELTDLDADE